MIPTLLDYWRCNTSKSGSSTPKDQTEGHTSHPFRYSFLISTSASGTPFALSVFASHSSGLPTRYDTTPSSTASVSAPEYAKLHVVDPPVLIASTHSLWWPIDFGIEPSPSTSLNLSSGSRSRRP